MKKIYLLTVVLAIASYSFAQKTYNEIKVGKIEYSAKNPDTLIPASVVEPSSTVVLSNTGAGLGYVCGSNQYNDKAKVQRFEISNPIYVKGLVAFFGAKDNVGATDSIVYKLYNFNGTGVDVGNVAGAAPGTVLASKTQNINDIKASTTLKDGKNIILFDNMVKVENDFGLGIDLTKVGGTKIGLLSTKNGDAQQANMVWEQQTSGTWASFLLAGANGGWGLDLDLLIFAIIDDAQGINSDNFINGIKLGQNQPNPATGSTLVQYEIEKVSDVSFEIFDITGRTVYSSNEGIQTAGLHTIVFDASQIQKGTYFYSLIAGDKRLVKQMLIQ